MIVQIKAGSFYFWPDEMHETLTVALFSTYFSRDFCNSKHQESWWDWRSKFCHFSSPINGLDAIFFRILTFIVSALKYAASPASQSVIGAIPISISWSDGTLMTSRNII